MGSDNSAMQHDRLHALADGIFAIVMTLLVLELKVPHLPPWTSNAELWGELKDLFPIIGNYILSFSLLFTYWKAHHFFISVYAKNVDSRLANINTIFLMLVALIPFTSSILAEFNQNQVAIAVFGGHIILIGLTTYWMRRYVFYSPHIQNPEITVHEVRGSTIRTVIPMIFAAIAIALSFWNPTVSLAIFTLAVLFNLSHWSTKIIDRMFRRRKNQD